MENQKYFNVFREKNKKKFHNQAVLDLAITIKILRIETFVAMKCEKCY